jgi:hypothetical protein
MSSNCSRLTCTLYHDIPLVLICRTGLLRLVTILLLTITTTSDPHFWSPPLTQVSVSPNLISPFYRTLRPTRSTDYKRLSGCGACRWQWKKTMQTRWVENALVRFPTVECLPFNTWFGTLTGPDVGGLRNLDSVPGTDKIFLSPCNFNININSVVHLASSRMDSGIIFAGIKLP